MKTRDSYLVIFYAQSATQVVARKKMKNGYYHGAVTFTCVVTVQGVYYNCQQ